MTSEAIFEKVKNALAETLGIDADTIKPRTSFEEIGMDSLDAVSLINDLEEVFDVSIPNEEIFQITTVAEVIAAIERHQ